MKADRTADRTLPKKRIEVFRAGLGRRKWAFRFVAANGEKVAQSELYRHKGDAIGAASLIKAGFGKTPITVEDEPDGLAPDPEGL